VFPFVDVAVVRVALLEVERVVDAAAFSLAEAAVVGEHGVPEIPLAGDNRVRAVRRDAGAGASAWRWWPLAPARS
jgi:hypothetical protein